jgi:hypothetical protein
MGDNFKVPDSGAVRQLKVARESLDVGNRVTTPCALDGEIAVLNDLNITGIGKP